MEKNLEEKEENGGMQSWMQDNSRIILAILIVLVIAVGIYSYSRRTEVEVAENLDEEVTSEEVTEEIEEGQEDAAAVAVIDEEAEIVKEEAEVEAEEVAVIEEAEPVQEEKAPEQAPEETATPEQEQAAPEEVKIDEPTEEKTVSISEETMDGFVETAAGGDSLTTLARKATRNYLEKNNDASLTAEHKIYIEDYLRRRVGFKAVHVGTKVSFSKIQIKDAIEKSKTLSEEELNYLKRYSAIVPGL